MDKKRLAELGGRGSPDKVRLTVLAVLLILVAALFFYARSSPPMQGVSTTSDFSPVSQANEPPACDVNPALLAPVADSTQTERVTTETEPLLHLLMEAGKTVPGDFRRLESRVIDDALYQEILADPAAFRGQAFTAKGLFLWADAAQVDLGLDQPGAEKLTYYRGLAQDDLGHAFTFSILNNPEEFSAGDIVKVEGFFLKNQAIFAKDDETQIIEPTVHLVGKKLTRTVYQMEPVQRLDMALMNTVRDYELNEQEHIEDEVLFHALSFVQNVDADELASVADDRTSMALRTEPQQFRGHPVRVLGTFYDTWRQELGPEGENPLELPHVYHGLLVHGGPTFTYVVCLEKEPEWLRRDTNVIAEGIFVKRFTYVAKNGVPVTCPLLVVKRFIPFRVNTSKFQDEFTIGFIIVAVILFVWFGLSLMGDRRAAAEYRQRYYARRRAQIKARMGNSPEEKSDS